MGPRGIALAALGYAVGAAALFAFGTVAANQVNDAWLTAAVAAGALLVASALSGLPSRAELRAFERADWALAVGAGVAGVFGSFYLVMSNRYSDAPSGSETLFFTTAAWGLIAVLAGAALGRQRPTLSQLVAALTGLVGAAAVVADWERPSSFSPFVKFPREEAMMLVAGLLWAGMALALATLAERRGARTGLWVAAAAGTVAAVGFAALTAGSAAAGALAQWGRWLPAAIAFGVTVTSLGRLVGEWTVPRAAGPLFLAPLLVTALALGEGLVRLAGPSPLVVAPLLWGVALGVVGTAGVMIPLSCAGSSARRLPGATAILRVAAVVAVAAAVVGLATPAISVTLAGELGDGSAFTAAWLMPGSETAGGWAALCGALFFGWVVACGARTGSGERAGAISRAVWCAAGALVASSYPWLTGIPLRTWTRWVPAEVQQDYGTEYARLAFSIVANRWQQAAVVLSVLFLLGLGAAALVSVSRAASDGASSAAEG